MVKISNLFAYAFIIFGFVILATASVNAASNPGHPISQIDAPTTGCSDAQFLRYDIAQGGWYCDSLVSAIDPGAGLTGSGTTMVTLNVGAGTGITVGANSINLAHYSYNTCSSGECVKSFDLSTGALTCVSCGGSSGGGYWTAATSYIYANNVPAVNGYVVVENTGNVGIGPSDHPTQKLDVGGSSLFRNAVYFGPINSIGGEGAITWTSNKFVIEALASRSLSFITGGASEKMIIDTNGNVGIGTSSPGEKLEVAGNIKATGGAIAVSGSTPILALQDTDASGSHPLLRFENNDMMAFVGGDNTQNKQFNFYSTWAQSRSSDAELRVFGKSSDWTKYIMIKHDGTNGIIDVDSGNIVIQL